MVEALTKRIEGLTQVDLNELTQRGWPDSENVEYTSGPLTGAGSRTVNFQTLQNLFSRH